jgi:hypothetical protein
VKLRASPLEDGRHDLVEVAVEVLSSSQRSTMGKTRALATNRPVG